MRSSVLAAIPLFFLDVASAAHFNVRGLPRPRRRDETLFRRANITGSTSISNIGDVQYTTDIKLGGKDFTVQVDTGSSDLWVVGVVPGAVDTGREAKVTYAVGEIEGEILTAPLEFAGYTVNAQAYISVAPSQENPMGSGLIGLGPNFGSQVSNAFAPGDRAGDSVLDRIFLQNTSTPNFVTFLLGRNNDPTDPPTGDFTIGEILPGFESVTSQPKLPVSVVAHENDVNQHWQILLDADGFIGPAGNDILQEFDVETAVESTKNKKQLTVVIDTGFSLPQVPSDVAAAIYSGVPDAQLVTRREVSGKIWQIPCDKEINITLKFGGINFPVHPLDTNIDLNLTDGKGSHVCFGSFQPMDPPEDATFDAIFGMSFLRNAYTLINFGDFIEGNTSITTDPFVQMLPTTNDTAEAHSDFLQVRGYSPWTPHDPESSVGHTLLEQIRSHLPLVIGVSVGAGVLLLLAIVGCFLLGRRNRVQYYQPGPQPYQRLHEPAPEAYNMAAIGGQGGNFYAPPPPKANGSKRYSNPWDVR